MNKNMNNNNNNNNKINNKDIKIINKWFRM